MKNSLPLSLKRSGCLSVKAMAWTLIKLLVHSFCYGYGYSKRYGSYYGSSKSPAEDTPPDNDTYVK